MKNKSDKKHSVSHVTKNVWYMFRYTFKYAPGYIWVTLVEGFGRAFWHILGVIYVKYLFDAIERRADFTEVLTVSLCVAAYNAAFELFNKWMLHVYRPRANLSLHEGMQKELYKKARELDQSCYDDPEFYNDFIWAIRESDGRTVQMMIDLSLFLNRVVSSVVILGLLFTIEPIVAGVMLLGITLSFLVKQKLNRVRYERSVEMNPIDRKLGYIGRIFYLPEYAKELRQGEIADTMREHYGEATEEKVQCVKKYAGKMFWLSLAASLLTQTLPQAGITGYLIIRYVLDPSLSLGSFSASISATFKLYWTIDDIGNFLTKFHEHSLYIEKFRKFVDYEPKIKGELADVPEFQSLCLKNVDFRYPFNGDCNFALSNINIEVKKGERIALVGYNGAGKTTLIKLLMRLYDPSSGEILYNGENIKAFVPEAYRRHIGAVFQDYKVFAATVAENVLGGEYSEESKDEVMRAVCAASFEEKLASLPLGLDTELTREFSVDGVELSGGEAQKIAIARVFARPYELIIMDEPSSALDPVAEYNLNHSIAENAKGRTVIFISHRLSTTRMADRIYMFDGGKIVECGSHGELMALDGKYAEMYRAQAQKYTET